MSLRGGINISIMRTFILILTLFFLIIAIYGCDFSNNEQQNAKSPGQSEEITPEPQPSPSVPTQQDPLTDAVVKSDLIVLGNITDKQYEVVTVKSGNITGKFTYTVFTLTVEKVVKGDPDIKEVLIKVTGGLADSPGPLPMGPYFSVTDRLLACLQREDSNNYSILQLIWAETSRTPPPIVIRNGVRMDLEKWISEIIVIMKTNNMTTPAPSIYIGPDPLTDTVLKADLIVLGTITDKRYEVVTVKSGNVTGKFAYTIFTLSVEKVIKGAPDTKEVLIKVEGGPIGDIYQAPTGWYFSISDRVLLSLNKGDDNIYSLPYLGVLWIKGSKVISNPELQDMMGRVCKILRENNIPISLDEPCPEPAEPVLRPN